MDKVPARYAYINDSSPHDPIDGDYVPCDLYYVDLCDWDTNNDGYYGAMGPDVETDIIDMSPELAIGRLPASTEAELNTLIDKIIKYEISTENSDWMKKATLITTTDFASNYGYKNQTVQYFEDWGVPPANIQKLYQPNQTEHPGTMVTEDIQDAINEGRGFVNYYGSHSYYDAWSSVGYTNAHVNSLTNWEKTPIIAAIGCCLSAGFDMPEGAPDIGSVIDEECIGEHFLLNSHGGAIAYFGATRTSGWGFPLDEMFWNAVTIYDTTGECWKDAIAKADYDPGTLNGRKTLAEYVLLGDPSLRIRGQIYFVDDFEKYNTGDAYTQSAFVERWDIDESAGREWRVDIDEHSGNQVLAIDEDGGQTCIVSVWRSIAEDWADYTLDADLRFAAGDYEWVPWFGIAGRHFEDTENETWGAYIVELFYSNGGAAVRIWKLVDSDDPGYVCGDSPEDVMDCIGGPVPLPPEMWDLIPDREWLHIKVGFATVATNNLLITAYVTADEGVDENGVIVSVVDHVDVIDKGGLGLFTAAYAGQVVTTEFDNVIVTKGCIFNDQFESETFSNDAWISNPPGNLVLDNGELSQDGGGTQTIKTEANISIPQDVILQADMKMVSTAGSYNRMGFRWRQQYGPHDVFYHVDYFSAALVYDTEETPSKFLLIHYSGYGDGPSCLHIPYDFNISGQWYNLKLVMSSLGPERYASVYVDGKLIWSGIAGMIDKDIGKGDYTVYLESHFNLLTKYCHAHYDNVYVEELQRETLKSSDYHNLGEGTFIHYGGSGAGVDHYTYHDGYGCGLKFEADDGAYGWVFNQPVMTNYTVHTKLNISSEQTLGIAYVIVNEWMVLRLEEWGSYDSVEFIKETSNPGYSGGWGTNERVDLERDKFYDVTVHVRREGDKIIYTGYLDGEFVSRYERTSPSDISGRAGIGAESSTIYSEYFVVEGKPDCISPAVSITSPGGGDTVSGIITVETTVSDTGGGSISHSALYANDTLVAVNTSSSSDNPIFKFDTSLLPAGECALTVVAVDNAENSNWTAITVDVNKEPVANFTYFQSSPNVGISISQPEGAGDTFLTSTGTMWQTFKAVSDTITAVNIATGREGYDVWITIEDTYSNVLGTSNHNTSKRCDAITCSWTHLDFASPVKVTLGKTYKIVYHDPAAYAGLEASSSNPYPGGLLHAFGEDRPDDDLMFQIYSYEYPVQFTDTSTDPDGNIISWYWNFGDNTTSTAQDPTHQFSSAGTYTVNLTVTDDDGATDSVSKSINVPPGICGDVNKDGSVDIFDAIKVWNRAGNPSYPLDDEWAADVNCDTFINVFDATKVKNRAMDPSYTLNCCGV